MKKILALGFILFGTKAFALETLANVTGDNYSVSSVHECMMTGWTSAEPSTDQTATARTMLDNLHTFIADRIENIQSLGRNVLAAWVRHPVSLTEVNTARSDLDAAVNPVKDEVTSTTVGIINLLTVAQRGKFDKAFATCMHQ